MKSKIEKALFITEKWCDGDPRKGITNSYHNLFGTFSFALPEVSMGVLHLDEIPLVHGKHVDSFIPQAIDAYNPDIVVVSHLGSSELNPSVNSYSYIKSKGIPICFTWPDTRDWVLEALKTLDNYASVNVSFGGEIETLIDDKHLNLWAPQDPRLYHERSFKFIPVSFVGSLQGNYTYRREYIEYLLKNEAPIIVAGGQREQGLAAEEYARIMRSSQMCINFPESAKPGFDQIKGRVFEVLASQSLLLEKKNKITPRYLNPGVHYVEYENQFDLLEKIKYFSSNPEEAQQIAKAGKQLYEEKYNPKIFWQKILQKLEIKNA